MRIIGLVHVPAAVVEGDKRQYAPFKLNWECTCGQAREENFTDVYLSYPTFGAVEKYTLYCSSCEAEYPIGLKLSLALEVYSCP